MRVIPLTRVTDPNTLADVLVVHVGLLVTPVQFTPQIRGISCVIVTLPAVMEFASNMAVSCGRGTRHAHPPQFVARNQLAVVDQLALAPIL